MRTSVLWLRSRADGVEDGAVDAEEGAARGAQDGAEDGRPAERLEGEEPEEEERRDAGELLPARPPPVGHQARRHVPAVERRHPFKV